jgi:hypothetical protein
MALMTPDEILNGIYDRAAATLNATAITNQAIRDRVDYVCRCMSNRACFWRESSAVRIMDCYAPR